MCMHVGWKELDNRRGEIDPNHVPLKPVQQSQVAMKKVVDGIMKDRRIKE